MQKVSRKCGNDDNRSQELAALRYAVLAVTNFLRRCLGASESLVLKVKQLPNGIKDLKTVKSGDSKQKKQTVPPIMCRRYNVDSAEGGRLIAGAYQALLRQGMLPWISGTYPD
jgi:hypothetical protein